MNDTIRQLLTALLLVAVSSAPARAAGPLTLGTHRRDAGDPLLALLPPWSTVSAQRIDPPCVGDCNGDGAVTVDEVITGVNIALDSLPLTRCTPLDANGDGQITVNELVIAVNAALNGCPAQFTPTPTPLPTALPTNSAVPTATPTSNTVATLATVQATIFDPTCTDLFCHSGTAPAGGLALTNGQSHDQLVGVASSNPAAQQAGLLRVKAGDPDHSFLIVKLTGPSPAQGSTMPLGKPALTAAQLRLIRDWITGGALP